MLPKLNMRIVKPAAGMPSSYTTRSARLDNFFKSNVGGAFGARKQRLTKSIGLSPREAMHMINEKKKYDVWLAKWERDPGIGRFIMLKEFINNAKGMSKSQLDEMFGNASELVFMHIYTFLRWNYTKECSIALQLRAMKIFFDASSGSCFANHFVTSNGTQILLDLLKVQDSLTAEDVVEILRVFISLTAHGPDIQMAIADAKFTEVFCEVIPKFKESELHQMTVQLFVQLAEGNESVSELFISVLRAHFDKYEPIPLHTIAHIFKILLVPQLAAEVDIKNTMSDFLALTRCRMLEVQHVGVQIFERMLENLPQYRQRFLLDTIIDMIALNIDDHSEDIIEEKLQQQTFATRIILSVLQKGGATVSLLKAMIQRVLPALIRAIGNQENFPAQKAAAMSVSLLAFAIPEVPVYLSNAMPNDWATHLIASPKDFCLKLTQTQLETFAVIEASYLFFTEKQEPEPPVEIQEERQPVSQQVSLSSLSTPKKPGAGIQMRPSPLKFLPTSK